MIHSRSIKNLLVSAYPTTSSSGLDRAGAYPKVACTSYYVDYLRRLRQAWRAGFSQGTEQFELRIGTPRTNGTQEVRSE
jgi:hypothetical protein